MPELIVLSNRGPLNFVREEGGGLLAKRAAGGLVVTLGPGVERDRAVWVAASVATSVEAGVEGVLDAEGFRLRPVKVDVSDYRAYYDVISNQTIWFCLHGLWDLPRRPRFDRRWWEAWAKFRRVNQLFADEVARSAPPGSTVLVQDYHLALVPGLLASSRPDLLTSAFIHTPWCSPAEFAVLPEEVARLLLEGLSRAGACGFHSLRWAEAFEECCDHWIGRSCDTFVSPAAPDLQDLQSVASSPDCEHEYQQLCESLGDSRLVVRVDRIEPSKNVLRGFWAFDELLETRPEFRSGVAFAAKVYPSRLGLAEYLAYGQEVEALAAQLNAKWGGPVLLDTKDHYPRSVAALRRADVLLVNPVRDGLNLVAKEGPLVNERDGVLVLSQNAGAWDELGEHAVGVNPFDVSGTAAAIGSALDMPSSERAERAESLRKAAGSRGPLDWFDDLRAAARTP